MMDLQLITTANNLEGYHISKHLGVVRRITVRSRSLPGILEEVSSLYLAANFLFTLNYAKKPGKRLTS